MTQALGETVEDLKRSNRDLDDFAYVASHDLRSPLRNISNLADWAVEDAEGNVPAGTQHHLERITSQISRMNRLLDDLLEYSRVGRLDEKLSFVDCNQLVAAIVESLAKPKSFEVVVPQSLPKFETLKTPLGTCLRNLISNAVQHHDRENGKVKVLAVDDGEFCRFDIVDDGPGIEERFQQRIFKIFQTLQAKNEGKGSGIGLAIVKKTIQSYGGRISLDSKPGEGTTFHLHWPKVIQQQELIDES